MKYTLLSLSLVYSLVTVASDNRALTPLRSSTNSNLAAPFVLVSDTSDDGDWDDDWGNMRELSNRELQQLNPESLLLRTRKESSDVAFTAIITTKPTPNSPKSPSEQKAAVYPSLPVALAPTTAAFIQQSTAQKPTESNTVTNKVVRSDARANAWKTLVNHAHNFCNEIAAASEESHRKNNEMITYCIKAIQTAAKQFYDAI
jgi:hypothetical protein